jgi:hypothetical protein
VNTSKKKKKERKNIEKRKKKEQAGAELCQAQVKLGLVKLVL